MRKLPTVTSQNKFKPRNFSKSSLVGSNTHNQQLNFNGPVNNNQFRNSVGEDGKSLISSISGSSNMRMSTNHTLRVKPQKSVRSSSLGQNLWSSSKSMRPKSPFTKEIAPVPIRPLLSPDPLSKNKNLILISPRRINLEEYFQTLSKPQNGLVKRVKKLLISHPKLRHSHMLKVRLDSKGSIWTCL